MSDQNANDPVFRVTPQDAKGERLVIASWNGGEHRDQFNTSKERARRHFFEKLAAKLKSDLETLMLCYEAELCKLADEADERARDEASAPPVQDLLGAMDPQIVAEAEAMLIDPGITNLILNDAAQLGVAGERELALTIYLAGVSRLLPRPLAAIVQGLSSSGKSFTIDKTARLFPPEAVMHATQMTPQALFHLPPGSLEHRFVVAGERSRSKSDESAEATRALREMISGGRLVKLMPVKIGGEIVTRQIIQEGPIAFVESTTVAQIFEEDRNRCVLLQTDEQKDQTQRILKSSAAAFGGADNKLVEAIVQKHHALQRLLRPVGVIVPFAEKVAELFPSERVEARRAFPQLMGMVQASALLHQRQRQASDDRIVADRDDYVLARRLLAKSLGRLLATKMSDGAERFLERLKAWADGETFTRRKAKQKESASKSAVYEWIDELIDAGHLEEVTIARGPVPATFRLATDCAIEAWDRLPMPETVFSS